MKKEKIIVKKTAVPQQTQTGKRNVRTTGGNEQKNIVRAGKVDALKPKPKTPKPVLRAPGSRIEERIITTRKRKEYLDNYQYHETKDIKNKNPRFQVIVEHKRLGDIIGGFLEETSYQKQVNAQGSSRQKITEKKTTVTTGGTASQPRLRGNKSEVTEIKKTSITKGSTVPNTGSSTVNKRTTTTTTTTKTQRGNPTTATGGKEKITETTVKRRNEGTTSKTETKTETKTTTSGTRGGQKETSTTTKTTTKTTGQKPEGGAETTTTQKTSTTTKTTTTTTKTTGGDDGTKTETVTKVEEKGESAGGDDSSIRKKNAKEKLEISQQ